MLFNVGFLEAMRDLDWDCLIFHDVDHIPENDRNYYGCGQMPRHFAAKLDKYMYMWVEQTRDLTIDTVDILTWNEQYSASTSLFNSCVVVVVSSSLPYSEFFGGVSGLTVEQFRKINGFPNAFWGWGGEDDDLWNRLVYQ